MADNEILQSTAVDAANEYDASEIQVLEGLEAVRKRPGMYIGSISSSGLHHLVYEIVDNAIDEALAGYCSEISVTINEGNTITVVDNGRGIPVDYNKAEERWNWDLVFCELYAGGKYGEGSGNYDFSLGLNGLGLCATQYSSEWMTADIYRDGMHYHLDFKKGENVGGLKKEPFTGRRTGSVIRWKPDTDVFTDINVPADTFKDMLRRQAVVNDGVTLVFIDRPGERAEKIEYFYEHGIQDYANEIAGEGTLTPVHFCSGSAIGRDRDDQPEYQVKMNVAFCFSNAVQTLEYYHNSSWLEHGGSPDRAVRLAFVNQINNWLKNKGLYKKNESSITFNEVQDSLILVSSSFSTRTSYENQTKKAITNKFIQDAMSEFLRQQLQVFFIENHDDAERMAAQVLINKRSRETAERTRLGAKKKLSEKIDIANRVQKFVDCRTKEVDRREIYIVEGDSALGACKQSRDAEFQGLMPVRGKILNCLKADYPRIFKSDVITDLMKVLGCGVEVQGKAAKELSQFDLNNLRWSKVVICTDGDVDGFQIRTLILTMLYRLCPTLIREGYVYIAETPLFEITYREKNADKTWFAYSEKEKADIVRQLEGKKFTVQRSKGLGENDPEMMWLTTMNPESRRLIKVQPADVEETARVFDLLLGDNLAGRKEHIAEHGAEYLDDLDVS